MLPLRRLPLRPLAQSPRRCNSTAKPAKLAKPTKFTPPSHPSMRPLKDPINYPGPPPRRDPATAQYPEMMPLPNTWAYWILNNRRLHLWVTLGVLGVLGGVASAQNFARTSPFAEEIQWEWSAPLASSRRFMTAWRKTVQYESARVAEIRKRKVEDVEKRAAYRRAHGLEPADGKGGLGTWKKREPGPPLVVTGDSTPIISEAWVEEELRKVEEQAARAVGEAEGAMDGQPAPDAVRRQAEKKHWWQWW